MKSVISLLTASIIAACVPTPAQAMDCVRVAQADLEARLAKAQFPLALLSKVHVHDTRVFGDFVECPPTWADHATMDIYAQRSFPFPELSETLSFMVFEYSSAAARDKAMRQRNRIDAQAAASKDDKVVYYLEPGSRRAFRVELWRGIPLG